MISQISESVRMEKKIKVKSVGIKELKFWLSEVESGARVESTSNKIDLLVTEVENFNKKVYVNIELL